MEAVMKLVDKTEKILGHTPHPAIVALPIGAWAVSNVSDVMGLFTGDESYDDAARISMGIGLVGAAAAMVTGLWDYSMIAKDSPSHDVATRHGIGNAVVGSLFTLSYLLRRKGREPGALARLLGLAGGGLTLYTAWLGGVLVEEMGEGVKPVMEQRLKQGNQMEGGKRSSGQRQPAREAASAGNRS
jgi:uncharacterized membrane protein